MASFDQLPGGKWRARIRRGKHKHLTHTAVLKADAMAWARKIESELERGVWKNDASAETVTLHKALKKYLFEKILEGKEEKDPGYKTQVRKQRGNVSILNILLAEPEATLFIANFGPAHVRAMSNRWAKTPLLTGSKATLSPGSIHRRMHTLAAVLNYIGETLEIPGFQNPVHGVKLPKVADERDRRISDDELSAIYAAGAKTRHLVAFVGLAIETGMRRAEIVKMRWRDVHAAGNSPTVHIPETKNGSPRDVPLTPAAVTILQGFHRKKGDAVARVFHGWASPDSATRAFVRAVKSARKKYQKTCVKDGRDPDEAFLTDIRLHDLRHEALSRLTERYRFVPQEVAKISGHKTLQMVMRYSHPKAKDLASRMRNDEHKEPTK